MFPLLNQLASSTLVFFEDTLYRLPAVLIALTMHEWAHGFVAYRLGDPTAKQMGRLSLNPIRHLDPVGTLMLIFLRFGYAKPVPVNPGYFKNKHRDDFLVSIAGITMNLILYFLFFAVYFFLWRYIYSNIWVISESEFWVAVLPPLSRLITSVAVVNLSIAIFNLLPVPPLDGFHLLNDLILKGNLFVERQVAQIGMGLLLVLSFTGVLGEALGTVTGAAMDGTLWLLDKIFGA